MIIPIAPSVTTPDTLVENIFTPAFFDTHFSLLIAQTPTEKRRAFTLRHAVFIEELRYDLGNSSALNIEHDDHDQQSLLCLLHHKATGLDVGCLRVVLFDEQNAHGLHSLPLEAYYGAHLFLPNTHPRHFASHQVCEVSRLAVHPTVRRKQSEVQSPYESIKESPALLSLSLFLAATALVGLSQRHHVFAMLEPRFSRLLKASGLQFHQVGGVIDYCGSRAAYYIDQRVAEERLPKRLTPLYQFIKGQLASQLAKSPLLQDGRTSRQL
ncbi:PEP-CTERM/exosortase system-associated acyltransferase [Halomonas sp. 18071143]|uniref:PEP-CTERM/exosortase system-associated acyltransferase n=1 Tax=Halomonas sp. 18071143 TaxID=2855441 RepID=UPI001C458055|nr:PEP-CTERM/exosortase system-associated acyltransferase [Halomonas sp. 18071143]